MKTLVVAYSRTGHTLGLARRIAAALDAPLEEIAEHASRRGLAGYLRSGLEAALRRVPALAPARHDPAQYDLVAIGTPVWNWSVSSPVRAYLEANAATLPQVAFFCTLGGSGSARAFAQMEDACEKAPVASLAVTEAQLGAPGLDGRIAEFVARLGGRFPRA